MTGRTDHDEQFAATTLDTGPLEHLLWASRLVVRRWREGRSAPDEIALLDIALARYEDGSVATTTFDGAVAESNAPVAPELGESLPSVAVDLAARYKAALEEILEVPTNATVLNVHFIAKEALSDVLTCTYDDLGHE